MKTLFSNPYYPYDLQKKIKISLNPDQLPSLSCVKPITEQRTANKILFGILFANRLPRLSCGQLFIHDLVK
jgi:hypothetical protein